MVAVEESRLEFARRTTAAVDDSCCLEGDRTAVIAAAIAVEAAHDIRTAVTAAGRVARRYRQRHSPDLSFSSRSPHAHVLHSYYLPHSKSSSPIPVLVYPLYFDPAWPSVCRVEEKYDD